MWWYRSLSKRYKIVIKLLVSFICIILFSYYTFLLVISTEYEADLLFYALGIMTTVFWFLSLCFPRFFHSVIYKIGKGPMNKSNMINSIPSQQDSYKNFEYLSFLISIFGFSMMIIGIIMRLCFIY